MIICDRCGKHTDDIRVRAFLISNEGFSIVLNPVEQLLVPTRTLRTKKMPDLCQLCCDKMVQLLDGMYRNFIKSKDA